MSHAITANFVGEIVSGSEEEDDDEDVETYMNEQQSKLEEEKAAILNDQSLIAEVMTVNILYL